MNKVILEDAAKLGRAAAAKIAQVLRDSIARKGSARIVVSTGASQFTTIEALVAEDVDWSKVTMFHLDEYIGLPETHPASFRKYLKERFAGKINLKEAVYVNGEADNINGHISALSERLQEAETDVGVIGIGENAHIAFNDPPADFDTNDAYISVKLNEDCKMQQTHEKWFGSVAEVPDSAITMTCKQIMRCKCIVSPVPYSAKAKAIKAMLSSGDISNLVPATLLLKHPDFNLFLDKDSASLL